MRRVTDGMMSWNAYQTWYGPLEKVADTSPRLVRALRAYQELARKAQWAEIFELASSEQSGSRYELAYTAVQGRKMAG